MTPRPGKIISISHKTPYGTENKVAIRHTTASCPMLNHCAKRAVNLYNYKHYALLTIKLNIKKKQYYSKKRPTFANVKRPTPRDRLALKKNPQYLI